MSLELLPTFLDGGRAFLCVVCGLCFMRLHRSTKDRLYLGFAFAFALLAVNSALLGLHAGHGDYSVLVFVPRLLAFLAIIASIIDKNHRSRQV